MIELEQMFADLLLEIDKFSERDQDIIRMCDTAREAGEPVSQRNLNRLHTLHLKIKGDSRND